MDFMIGFVVVFSGILIVYHHAVYPLLLKWFALQREVKRVDYIQRGYQPSEQDQHLPNIDIVIPIYNEAKVIADKIHNLSILDYPNNKFHVRLYDDGSTDNSAQIIDDTLAMLGADDIQVSLIKMGSNQGKVAVINRAVSECSADLIFLTDASALLSVDALLIAASHFRDPKVGVLSATYRLLSPANEGEALYWDYQTTIKQYESMLGAPFGSHGSGYLFRRELFKPLEKDTINDDVILPMRIAAQGYVDIYETNLVTTELEKTQENQDWQRRQRIGAGNLQQLMRLKELLLPKYKGLSFIFISGKALRVVMPWCLLITLLGSLWLAPSSSFFALLALAQIIIYVLAIYRQVYSELEMPGWLDAIHYLSLGYLSNLVGQTKYFQGAYKHGWGKTSKGREQYMHNSVRLGKFIIDKLAAMVGLMITAVLFPFIALAIKLDSPGPIFYRQLRVGAAYPDHTELFMMIKFRTMRTDAESGGQAQWATKNDPRITKIGNIMRKTRLDELPQFINVLMGDMSLIGPRPERPSFFKKLEEAIPYYSERAYGVLPGITGYAQVYCGYDETIDDVRRKLNYDHAYALVLSHPSVWLMTDIQILFLTIKVMVLGRGQ